MYWKYPGSATVSLWDPLGSSRHTFGALQILYKRAMWDALLNVISEQIRVGVDTGGSLENLRNNLVFQTAQEEKWYRSDCR